MKHTCLLVDSEKISNVKFIKTNNMSSIPMKKLMLTTKNNKIYSKSKSVQIINSGKCKLKQIDCYFYFLIFLLVAGWDRER